jgi:all-trans-retinol dehydrogenase (NAD+)
LYIKRNGVFEISLGTPENLGFIGQASMQFSIGDIFALLDKTILNPLLTIPLVAYIHFFTANKILITPSTGLLPYAISRPLPPLIYRTLVLAGTGLVLRINRSLSRKALNNGVTAQFDWEHEIIVVTGGSGGIGAVAAQKLASRGSTVVILDVIPLTFTKRRFAVVVTLVCRFVC